MVRVILIDEPASDAALNGVLRNLEANAGGTPRVIRRVRMLHDGLGRINGEPVNDLLSGLELAEREHPREPISGIDLIGHGAPGVILLGASSAGGPRTSSGVAREWAQLDSDVNKLPALVPLAKRLRDMRAGGRLADSFEVRVLGCNTASDPGITPRNSLGILQDGPVLIHLLASFLDSTVSGVIGYIGPENFARGSFDPGEAHVRSCVQDTIAGTISFVPDSFPPGMPIRPIEGFPLGNLTGTMIQPVIEVDKRVRTIDPAALSALLAEFNPIALPLQTSQPLVIRDLSIKFPTATLDLVEHGKALVVRTPDGAYRSAPPRGNLEQAQEAVARFLEGLTSKRPLWANPAATRALYF